jgi:lantibiotic biosynthesis protein
MNYKNFNNYILRTPLLSLDDFNKLFNKEETSYENIINFINNPKILESIYIASPDLYSEIQKTPYNNISYKEKEKLKRTIIKYISRLCSRPTPFGLFAGCEIGSFKTNNEIILSNKYKRVTRLDMNFLVNLVSKISKTENIKKQLFYFPNTTLFQINNSYRYLEHYTINEKRFHQLVSTEKNEHIYNVIKMSTKGISYQKLIENLTNLGISKDTSNEYICNLIDNQILVSELEPTVSSLDYLEDIIHILESKENLENIIDLLKQIKYEIKKLDKNHTNKIKEYESIVELIKKLNVDFKINNLFQVDVSIGVEKNTLDETIIKRITKCMKLLETIDNEKSKNSDFNDFKKNFINRYGDKEIPLSLALDNEIGINYGIESEITNSFINDLIIFQNKTKIHELENTNYSHFLNKKILDGILDNKHVIEIHDSEINIFETTKKHLPNTISSIIQIVLIDDKIKLKFSNVGGSSAANLMARFCTSNLKIHEYTKEIVKKEEEIEKKIIAEIIHLPESRVGNILMKPNLRKYEIPYLAKSNLKTENQILVNDLYIRVKNDKLILFSKKLKKEITPRLTNAHNFNNSTLPIYKFLCDFQYYEKKNSLSFNLGSIVNKYNFIPRIEYKDIILSEATWILNNVDFNELFIAHNSQEQIFTIFKKIKKNKKIPNNVLLIEGDNKLLLNLKNNDFILILIDIIKKNTVTILTEFLFDKNCIVQNNLNENFTNEIIISFFKNENNN